MYINRQALIISGVSNDDYLTWCTENDKKPYEVKVRKEFFERILNERLVRDGKTGHLVNKRPKGDATVNA